MRPLERIRRERGTRALREFPPREPSRERTSLHRRARAQGEDARETRPVIASASAKDQEIAHGLGTLRVASRGHAPFSGRRRRNFVAHALPEDRVRPWRGAEDPVGPPRERSERLAGPRARSRRRARGTRARAKDGGSLRRLEREGPGHSDSHNERPDGVSDIAWVRSPGCSGEVGRVVTEPSVKMTRVSENPAWREYGRRRSGHQPGEIGR